MSKAKRHLLCRVNILLGAIIALLGFGGCKTIKTTTKAPEDEQQSAAEPIEVVSDNQQVVCLYGPPPMLLEYEKMRQDSTQRDTIKTIREEPPILVKYGVPPSVR